MIVKASYTKLARVFVIRFCAGVLTKLHNAEFVSAEAIRNLDEEASDKLFAICFRALEQFEDIGGFTHDGSCYFAHELISTSLTEPAEFLDQVQRTELRGSVDDDVLKTAFAVVRDSWLGSEKDTPKRRNRRESSQYR
jgi:hypothetical protein